jgi:nitrate/nitrite transporter NarK
VIFYLDSSIEEAKWLTSEDKVLLTKNLIAEDKHKTEHNLADAFKSGKVWVLCAIYFTLMIGLYGIAFWLPTIVKAFGIKGYLGVGLVTAIPYGVAVIGMILLSVHSDKTGERRLHYVFNVTSGAIGLVLSGIFASNPVLAIIFLSIGTLGVIGSMPLFWPLPSAFLAGTAAAAGIGIVNSVGNLGGYFGPNIPIWAKLFSSNRSAALYIIAGILMVGAFLAFFFVPKNLRVSVGSPT